MFLLHAVILLIFCTSLVCHTLLKAALKPNMQHSTTLSKFNFAELHETCCVLQLRPGLNRAAPGRDKIIAYFYVFHKSNVTIICDADETNMLIVCSDSFNHNFWIVGLFWLLDALCDCQALHIMSKIWYYHDHQSAVTKSSVVLTTTLD